MRGRQAERERERHRRRWYGGVFKINSISIATTNAACCDIKGENDSITDHQHRTSSRSISPLVMEFSILCCKGEAN